MRAPTSPEMRAIDAAAVARDGEVALMRRAGEAIAALVTRYARAGPIVGIAGGGNNGGDVFAALAALDRSRERIVFCDAAARGSTARADAIDRARAAGVTFRPLRVDPALLAGAGLLLDGVLGANARLPLDPASAAHVVSMNASGTPILAIDVPTGLDPSTGALDDPHVHAVATIALGAPKLGTLLEPGRSAAGDLWCADLGMRGDDAEVAAGAAQVLTDDEFVALLPRRTTDSDKRRSGAPLVIAGSEQFPGAAILCARGAARAGAGYVTVATSTAAAAVLRHELIEQVVVPYDESDGAASAGAIARLEKRCGSIAIGPGLDSSDAMGELVRTVIAQSSLPIVADAGALFHLAGHLDVLRGKTAVITPHEGEFARVSGGETIAPGERLVRLRAFVAEHGITTLLKGPSTLIADREHLHVNPTGTPALATAGTGDVLTGMIGTLLAQGLAPIDAARVATFWHGRAGMLAARRRPIGVIAGDLPDLLADAAQPPPAPPGPRLIFGAS